MGAKLDGTPACAIAYFGDGSASRGRLPRGGEHRRGVPCAGDPVLPEQRLGDLGAARRSRPRRRSAKRAEGYGFPGVRVDGNDVLAVYRVTQGRGRARARGRRPDADRGADVPDRPAHDRRRREALPRRRRGRAVARARSDRPVPHGSCSRAVAPTTRSSPTCEDEAEARSRAIRADVIATRSRRRSEGCSTATFAEPPAHVPRAASEALARCLRSRWSAALNAALRDALDRGPARRSCSARTSASSAGVFRVTDGLQREFGAERVFDTPIAEAGIVGVVRSGSRWPGGRPIAEMQFDGFSYPALDQVISHVAKYRERTRGRVGDADRDPHPVVRRDPRARSTTARARRRTTCTRPG